MLLTRSYICAEGCTEKAVKAHSPRMRGLLPSNCPNCTNHDASVCSNARASFSYSKSIISVIENQSQFNYRAKVFKISCPPVYVHCFRSYVSDTTDYIIHFRQQRVNVLLESLPLYVAKVQRQGRQSELEPVDRILTSLADTRYVSSLLSITGFYI